MKQKELPQNQQGQNFLILKPENFNAEFDGNQNNVSAYINFQFTPIKNLNFNAGIRYDYIGFSEKGNISPRLNGSYQLNKKSSINFATGIYYQDPLFINIADNRGAKLDPEMALHYIFGFKHYFTPNLKFTAEAYYKDFKDIIVRPNSAINNLANQGEGKAYGIDFSLVKRLSNNVNGQISYSYSESKRDNNDGIGEYNHLYSQPHLFNFLLNYQPNSKWILAGKIRYSTGQPTNSSIIYSDVHNTPNSERFGQELTGRYDLRNDDIVAIDVRIDRRFQFSKSASLPL